MTTDEHNKVKLSAQSYSIHIHISIENFALCGIKFECDHIACETNSQQKEQLKFIIMQSIHYVCLSVCLSMQMYADVKWMKN